jgi:Domain of unknown function (DUF4259)
MGTWGAEPFSNDVAADWAWELDDANDWQIVREALSAVLAPREELDEDFACVAIAAAEVVAMGLGRGTQDDAFTEGLKEFVVRASTPTPELVQLALDGLAAATGPNSGLTLLWAEVDPTEWNQANARLETALRGR